jgi:hypothetical protein
MSPQLSQKKTRPLAAAIGGAGLLLATTVATAEGRRCIANGFPDVAPLTAAELGAPQQYCLLERHAREDRPPQPLNGLGGFGFRHHARIGELKCLAVAP